MRILFLSRWYPYPADNGSKLRVFALLRGLCERHDVTLVSFFDPSEVREVVPACRPAPREIRVSPYSEFDRRSVRAIAGFLGATPRYLVDTRSTEMERLIRDAVARAPFDLVIASQLSMAAYCRCFRGIPAIFEEVELGVYWPYGQDGRRMPRWSRARRRLTWEKHRRFIARLVRNFALCTVASETERELLGSAVPGYPSVHVVPNSVEVEPAFERSGARAPLLIFTGSLRYGPNRDAMEWFLGNIFPSVRASVAGVRLRITGDAGQGPPLTAPTDDVVFTGRVPDVRSLVAASAVSIAPIRAGGGTRLKILEAMAVGTPVVATSKAVEGLGLRHDEHALVADEPRAFADAVSRLLGDPKAAQRLAERARAFCRERFDSRVVVPQFLRLVDLAGAA